MRNKTLKRMAKLFLPLILFVAPVVAEAQAASPNWIQLGWTASPSPGITNYTMYQGISSSNYVAIANVGNVTSGYFSNLVSGTTYFFNVKVTDNNGQTSDFANEISYFVPFPKPVPPGQLKKLAP